MIFDVANRAARGRAQSVLERRRVLLERPLRRQMRAELDRQFAEAARQVAAGHRNVDHVVDAGRGRVYATLVSHLLRVGGSDFAFVEDAWANRVAGTRKTADFKQNKYEVSALIRDERGPGEASPMPRLGSVNLRSPESKGMAEEFWRAYYIFTRTRAADAVVGIQETTKRLLRRLLRTGAEAGDSYASLADRITERMGVFNARRAMRIARTETHTASAFAMNESVRSTRVPMEREWVAVMDERTRPYAGEKPTRANPWDHRHANGQRVGMNEPFTVSGEKLRYPGDPKGSAGNIVNCRCVVLYHAAHGYGMSNRAA